MSQLEQDFRRYLALRPDVERCSAEGLINRRALARHLVKQGISKPKQLEALIGMLRRHKFSGVDGSAHLPTFRIAMKDGIALMDLPRDNASMKALQEAMRATDYDKGHTFKMVTGTAGIKAVMDTDAAKALSRNIKTAATTWGITEISMLFAVEARNTKGIVSTVATELALHGIVVQEILTASPELLLYVRDSDALSALGVLRTLLPPATR
ncbi:hypothetical protein COY28_00085 [Candidatus Woesearchaeota archaeon CG_4_10_14_0_2_um_filter_57_5]|nr:MAG: hypothetical protein AUJ68_05950 [Candidatus Woesearchaeota archaeon CG1_02_57_44]PIZ57584.1 MAG: hypothetical protein COY28_00085 [Candidatus Woesearchaeota archaeon CG_4_10_14_0_2_um_filter_57_5]